MKINTDTHYLFRMTNLKDEDKDRYTLLIEDDNKMTLQDMEDEHKHRYTLLIPDDKHGR